MGLILTKLKNHIDSAQHTTADWLKIDPRLIVSSLRCRPNMRFQTVACPTRPPALAQERPVNLTDIPREIIRDAHTFAILPVENASARVE